MKNALIPLALACMLLLTLVGSSCTGISTGSTIIYNSGLAVSASALPEGTVGTPYSSIIAATGGTQPYSWSISTGSLPSGLTLSGTSGSISGTPTSAGQFSFTVKVTDSSSPPQTSTQALEISVSASNAGIDILNPVNSTTVSGSVIVSGTASGSTAIQSVEISINGEPYTPASGTTNWSFWWDTTSVANGPATVTVQATDAASSTITASITVAVDNLNTTCVGIPVNPTDNLKSLVASNPAGTIFCIQPGIHHDFDVLNQGNHSVDGDQFIGLPGAIENGAETLTGWTQVTISGTTYWTTPAGAPIIDTYNPNMNCNNSNHVTFTCYYSQALYLNDTTYEHAYRLQDVTAGIWYYEFNGLTEATVVSRGANYVVGDVAAVAGGTGCTNPSAGCGTVNITSVGSGGTVTGISLRALGYGYPESPTTKTTTAVTGNGSGLTLSVKGGSGGIVNNVYLASSEEPNSHTVELGENAGLASAQWLFHSTSAQNITIQGLTVEKYAGPLDTAPITANHIGSQGVAAGWIIQNNEVRLNMHLGIYLAYGSAGTSIKVLNNTVHDNGQLGIGGGSATSFLTISGNNVYSNDTAWVPTGYGCGSIKLGGPSTGNGGDLVSYNNIHDEPNDCGGLWSDQNMGNVTWDHNTVANISGDGIRIEISGTGPIFVTNNTVTASGQPQIELVSSANTTVEHNNLIGGSKTGIVVSYDGRVCGSGCPSPPANNNISLNSVGVASTSNGLGAAVINAAGTSSWVVGKVFDFNTYCVPSRPWTASSWQFPDSQSSFIDLTEWQADGQDMNGAFTDGTCPNAID
jgi:hypothetical protein